MTRTLLIATLLFMTGCGQKDPGPAVANEAASAQSAPAAPEAVPALAGQWSITAVDGRPVGADSEMTASFENGRASIASGCLRRAWTFTQKRNSVAFSANPAGSANCGGPPGAQQEAAFTALDLATMAIFGKDGTEASLSGNGGMLALKRR